MNRTQPLNLHDARVLVTGATSGVGEATARLFAARGSKVALLGRREEELQRVTAELGERSAGFCADVRSSSEVNRAVERASAFLGGVDIAVNAAGVAESAVLEDLDDAIWSRTLETNLSGTFYVCRALSGLMREDRGGSIVNVASDLAAFGVSGLAHYSAAKAGVVGLTRALAVELAPDIRVNVVCPGPIDSPMLRAGLEADPDPRRALEAKEASVPLRRLSLPEEVARAIAFLGVDGTFATGTVLAFDGGTSAA